MAAPELTTSVGPVCKAATVMSTLGIQNRFLKKILGVELIIFMSTYDVILHCFYLHLTLNLHPASSTGIR